MSLAKLSTDRSKFQSLLQFCQQQIDALESDDYPEFDRIIAAKNVLIEHLAKHPTAIESDPSLPVIAAQIQELDSAAQKLLFRKAGKVMREMILIHRQQNARHAYRTPKVSPMQQSLGFAATSSYFIDQKS